MLVGPLSVCPIYIGDDGESSLWLFYVGYVIFQGRRFRPVASAGLDGPRLLIDTLAPGRMPGIESIRTFGILRRTDIEITSKGS